MQRALKQPVIKGLDAARAFAIVLVVLFHTRKPVSGDFGVVLFFVLSGFLITGILLREFDREKNIRLSRFYIRRAFRIFPAFYVCWIFTLWTWSALRVQISRLNVLESLFYLSNYVRAFMSSTEQINLPLTISWSLAVEEQFYLVWPILLLALLKGGNPDTRLRRVVIAIILSIWVFRTILLLAYPASGNYVANAFETRADALMLGSLMAIVTARKAPARWMMLPVRSRLLGLPVLLAIAALWPLTHRPAAPLWLSVNLTLEALLALVVVWQLIFWASTTSPWLNSLPFRFLARISYSLYLYHTLFIKLLSGRLGHGETLLVFVLSIVSATLSWFLIEQPFLRLRDSFFRSPAGSPSKDHLTSLSA